ncbi:MAG: hypothetical protein JO369_01335 [Paucibacter sp.]|nr:hypothetical protein [Roseateles sp.]
MHRRALATTLAAALLFAHASTALAQVARHFTQNTLRGDLIVQQFPLVTIDGRSLRMAPGARVMSDTDHLIQPASLTGQTVTVNYTLEATTGLIMQIWVLNAAELTTTFWPHTPQQAASLQFDWATQTWSRP